MRQLAQHNLQDLLVKKGEIPDSRKFNELVSAIDSGRPLPGLNVRRRVLPYGTITSYDADNGTWQPTIWMTHIQRDSKGYALTIGKGLVNGIEPVIGGIPISGDADGKIPRLKFTKDDFDANGVAMLCLHVTLNSDWLLQKAEPAVHPYATPLTPQPWVAVKLIGFLIQTNGAVKWKQMCFFNIGLGTLYKRNQGVARWVWWGM